MPRYRVELPQLRVLANLIQRWRDTKDFEVIDVYNLGRDPRILVMTTQKPLTPEDIRLLSNLVPLTQIRIIEEVKEES